MALAVPVRPARGKRSPPPRGTEEGVALAEATWSPEKAPTDAQRPTAPTSPVQREPATDRDEGSWHTASPAVTPASELDRAAAHDCVEQPAPVTVTVTREDTVGDEGGFVSCTATGHMARRVSLVENIEAKFQPPLSAISSGSNCERTSGSAGPCLLPGTMAPPPSSERDTSVRFSLGGGINDAPAQATRALLEAKEALESRSAGNIKREIRERTVESLSLLHSLVLRLADSRSRAIIEAERIKVQRLKDLDAQEVRHNKQLEATIKLVEAVTSRMEKVDSTTESLRGVILHDVTNSLDGLRMQTKDLAREVKELPTRMEARPAATTCSSEMTMAELRQELNSIRAEIGSLRNAGSPRPQDIAGALLPSLTELIIAQQGEDHGGVSRDRGDEGEVPALLRDMQEALRDLKRDGPAEAGGDLAHGELTATVRDIGNQVALLTETTSVMGEMLAPLRTNVEELKKEIRTTAEMITEASGPTRAAIEQLRGELRGKALHAEGTDDSGAGTSGADRGTPSSDRVRRSRDQGELTARPRYGLRLESGVPGKTSQELIDQVKSEVDVAALGIAVSNVRKIRGQSIVVTCDSEDDREALSRAIKGTKAPITATPLKNRRPLIRLVGVANDLSNTQVPAAIINQNKKLIPGADPGDIRVIRRTRGRNSTLFNIVLEVSPRIWAGLKERRVHVGYQIVPALDQSPAIQCYNCMGFGHTARECRGTTTCGYCSAQHETRGCPNRNSNPNCCHCNQDGKDSHHPAYSADCPVWQKWDRLTRLTVSYC